MRRTAGLGNSGNSRNTQQPLDLSRKKGGSSSRNVKVWVRVAVTLWLVILGVLLWTVWIHVKVAYHASLASEMPDASVTSSSKYTSAIRAQKAKPQSTAAYKPDSTIHLQKNQQLSAPVAVIAHAVSFLNCPGSLTEKYKDAMLVLRHSIHQNSFHANSTSTSTSPSSSSSTEPRKSKYSYRMYAFVNNDPKAKCARFTPWIRRMGYTPLLLPNPVNMSSIQNEWFRKTIDGTGVAGSSELIKLYLYTLTDHPIVCHWDIDVIVNKPIDDLYDAILFDKESKEGKEARSRLKIQQPLYQKLPEKIDAFFTRDIALAKPWVHRQVAQGGFLVARTDQHVFQSYVDVVTEANFSSKCGDIGGWGGMGYGCQQGAMHYQGVVAYYYDQIHQGGGAVELDVCAWNQVAHSVEYTGKKEEWLGSCRQSPIYGGTEERNRIEFGACHDCRVYPVEDTMTIHYTACAKPWQCKYQEQSLEGAKAATTNAKTCGLLFKEFYRHRMDLENKLQDVIGSPVSRGVYNEKDAFYPEYFLGYCGGKGSSKYVGIDKLPEDFEMEQLYGF